MDYKIIEHLVVILKPFKNATKVWEADTVPTINQVIPEIFNIRDELVKHTRSSVTYIKAFSKLLLKSLDQRYPKLGCDNHLFAIAHFLDPFYRGEILKQFGGMLAVTKAAIVQRVNILEDTSSDQQSETVDHNSNESVAGENISAAERLVKRRRLLSMIDFNVFDSYNSFCKFVTQNLKKSSKLL